MNKGYRIINFFIDIIVISALTFIISDAFGFEANSIMFIVFFLYYLLFEYFLRQTVGKMITKTVVIDVNNNKPAFYKILLRTLLRFSALDAVSYMFGKELGIHDVLSKSRLIHKENGEHNSKNVYSKNINSRFS